MSKLQGDIPVGIRKTDVPPFCHGAVVRASYFRSSKTAIRPLFMPENICANPDCKHHRAEHFPVFPGYCRNRKCRCPRFMDSLDASGTALRELGWEQGEKQDTKFRRKTKRERTGQ